MNKALGATFGPALELPAWAAGHDGMGEQTEDETVIPQDRPPADEIFAERVARLVELLERWQAQIKTERWPAVPLSELDRDDPRRLPLEIADELLRAHGHLLAAVERVRSAAVLRRRMREEPDGEPGS